MFSYGTHPRGKTEAFSWKSTLFKNRKERTFSQKYFRFFSRYLFKWIPIRYNISTNLTNSARCRHENERYAEAIRYLLPQVKFTGKGESIENQIELCRQYIAMHFGEDAAENVLVYEDEGFSGGNLERPQFKKMMKDSQKIAFAAIVVYRLDRISRNIGDFAKLIEDLGDRHVDFISIREQFDTSSPMGRAMMYIASVFSQLERETIAERIRDNMHELSKTGRWLGGTTPTGYASESLSSVTVDGKVKKACKLKPIPEEIQLVKTIFSVFMETGSLSKTDQYLLEHRCVTKRGKQFTRFAIRGVLTNPVYMIADETAYQYLKENNVDLFAERSEFDGEHGVMAYNRTLQRPGKANQIRPMEEWIVAVGKRPGTIAGSFADLMANKGYFYALFTVAQ